MKRLVNDISDSLVNIMPLYSSNKYFLDVRKAYEDFNTAHGEADHYYTNRLFIVYGMRNGDGRYIGMTFWRGKTEMIQL